MIDGEELMQHIRARQAVRIGARGICIELLPNLHNTGWRIRIDRAFVEIEVDDVSVLDDTDYFILCFSTDGGRSYPPLADLRYYDKLTPLLWRVSRT